MTSQRVEQYAEELDQALGARQPIEPLSARGAVLDLATAYAVQDAFIARRKSRGARVVGKKIGLTSAAIRTALGVDEPDFGVLLDTMHVPEHRPVPLSALIQPKVEGEIAFVLDRDLDDPYVNEATVLRATAFVMPALEIIDSRITDWRITLGDTIADNASSGMFVLGGTATPVDGLDLRHIGMSFFHNGALISTAAGAACLGNPVAAVAWLANTLRGYGGMLRAGDVILSGGLAAPVIPAAGDWIEMHMQALGIVTARFEA